MAKKIILLGAKGMLGTEVRNLCNENLIALDLPEFDISNKDQLANAIDGADIVINCAAFTDVEKAESQYDLAHKINAQAVENLGQLAAEKNIYVIHISTDFVFDGKKDSPYEETDVPKPINAYGKSKLEGEILLMENHQNCSIIRVQWTYGKNGNNFISKLISFSKQKDSLKVVDDQFGSPTWTKEAAAVILEFAEKKHKGLFHYAAAGYASRYEVAKFAFEKLKLKTELIPCKSSEFKSAAARPASSRFCCDKIQALLDKPIEMWQNPLQKFLETI
ncbi:MAG: dTDP-4-dehydrorhamnose reductase [Phycisphaerales bacterium]